MRAPPTPDTEITLIFSAQELAQLEAFAALHGEPVAAFVQRTALEAAHITPPKASKKGARSSAGDLDALWLTESFADASEEKEPDLFAPVEAVEKPNVVEPTLGSAKKGVVGEPSALAKGHGPVWEIRRALGKERVHGLGWTREQLAFVLKLSVVGVRKMEHLGTTPVKSLESRQALLNLSKMLERLTPEIAAYIELEEAALS